MSNPNGFFAIDRRAWHYVSALGMNEAVAYLVMARGTGGDQRTTSWSVNAIEKYTGISRPRAQATIARLLAAKAIEILQSGSRPRYRLAEPNKLPTDSVAGTGPKAKAEAEWIWLPNTLVDGVDGNHPPIEVLRQTQDLLSIRIFIEFYYAQALQFDGGVEWRPDVGIRAEFTRKKVGEHGSYVIWEFAPDTTRTWQGTKWFSFAPPQSERGGSNTAFWNSFNILTRTGLVETVAHLVDADTAQGEVIHPLPYGHKEGEEGEREISKAAFNAAVSMLPDWQLPNLVTMQLVPLFSHLTNVQLIGIVRLKFRPHTKATAEWFSGATKWAQIANEYRAITKPKLASVTSIATSR